MAIKNEEAAYQHLESIRWPNGPICPHCGSNDHAYYLLPKNGYRTTKAGKITYRRLWKCAECRQQFSVLVGTIPSNFLTGPLFDEELMV